MKRFTFRYKISVGGKSLDVETLFDANDLSQAHEIKSDFRDKARTLGIFVQDPIILEGDQIGSVSTNLGGARTI